MIDIPLKRVEELEDDQKKIMIAMIRMISQDFGELHLGLEATEEALTELINEGLAKIAWDEENKTFAIMHYDFKTESYIIVKGE